MDHNEVSELLKDSLRKYGSVWVRLEGKSMLPFLKSGTSISVHHAGIKDIHLGDIVIFTKDDMTIAHRVFKKVTSGGRSFLQTKSDISFSPEPLISHEELIGEVVAFKRFGAEIRIDNFMFRLLGLGAGILFPFVARTHYLLRSVTSHAVQS